MNKEGREIFYKWLKTKPEKIQDMGEKFPVDCLVWINKTLQTATPASYSEDGTYTMTIFQKPFAMHEPSHNVFGMKEDDLNFIAMDYKELDNHHNNIVLELESESDSHGITLRDLIEEGANE